MKKYKLFLLVSFILTFSLIAQSPYADAGWLNYNDHSASGDILFSTVEIPYSTDKTFYAVLSWNGGVEGGGYAGLQKSGGYNGLEINKHVHFALWDPIVNNEEIKTVYVYDETVVVENFGGEGTGKKVLFPFEWQENRMYDLLVRSWSENGKTYFGYWFQDVYYQAWYHIVTLEYPVPDVSFEHFGSFLEDFGATASNSRKVLIRNGLKRIQNSWAQLTTAQFNVNPVNSDYNAGVEDNFYFMEIGGSTTPSISPGTELEISFNSDVILNKGIEITEYEASFTDKLYLTWLTNSTKHPQFSVHFEVYDNSSYTGNPLYKLDTLGYSGNSLSIPFGNSQDELYYKLYLKSTFDGESNIIYDSVSPSPSEEAPTPTQAEQNVISIFSDAYSSISDVNLNPNWGQATVVTEESINGNNTLKYSGLNYQGIDFDANHQDISGMDYVHLDYWTSNSTALNFFLISPGPVETPYSLTVPTNGNWVSVDIPLSQFAPVDLTDLFQFKFDGNGDIYIDNLYFYSTSDITERILLDEDFSDWQNIEPAYTDFSDDQISGNIDFRKMWIYNDNNYLFLRLELDEKILIQENNGITLYIDSDNNSSTGLAVSGIGAELEYRFGERSGTIRLGDNAYEIEHANVGLITSPTVSSAEFEMAIKLDGEFEGRKLFSSNNINVLIKDLDGQDQIPNENDIVSYSLITGEDQTSLPEYSIAKTNENHLRVVSYNVLYDNLFEPELFDNFSRTLNAIDPDIIGFQEVWDHSSEDAADLLEQILPSESGESWYHAKAEQLFPNYAPDVITASRYRIKDSYTLKGGEYPGYRPTLAVLLDMRPKYDTDLLVLNTHPTCCNRDFSDPSRQDDADLIMSFIRDAKNGTGDFTITQNTPIIIVGDMNYVGSDSQRNTILTGDIYDNDTYGSDFNPDWDGSHFADSKPYTTNLPMNFTWYNEGSSFSPGRLDHIFYSSSVLEKVNSYTLFTPALEADSLTKYGLQASDVIIVSDHKPVVADFELTNITSAESSRKIIIEQFELLGNYPNPFNPTTRIEFSIPQKSQVSIKIFDILGREVAELLNSEMSAGIHSIVFDASYLSSGVYFYKLESGNFIDIKKMSLIK